PLFIREFALPGAVRMDSLDSTIPTIDYVNDVAIIDGDCPWKTKHLRPVPLPRVIELIVLSPILEQCISCRCKNFDVMVPGVGYHDGSVRQNRDSTRFV